jgi:predicted nucleic acid-binding protein
VLVVDAGVVVAALVQADELGDRARALLLQQAAAPELVDLEVGSVIRRLTLSGRLEEARGKAALADLRDLPLQRASHRPLLTRCWELRDAVSFYDAAYVALAELLEVPLITVDAKLSRAPHLRCQVALL